MANLTQSALNYSEDALFRGYPAKRGLSAMRKHGG